MKAIIIEDEIAVRNDLKGLLKLHGQVDVIAETGSVHEAIILLKTIHVDVVFIDIHLEDGNAFDILNQLNEIHFQIIFVTAYDDYAIRAIKLGAMDYLLKPVDLEELTEALTKVAKLKNLETSTPPIKELTEIYNGDTDKLILKTSEGTHIIYISEIVYCKGDAGYSTFILKDNRKITVSKTLKEYDLILPKKLFFRNHQSYIVNIHEITLIDKNDDIVLRNHEKIPVATRKKEELMQLFSKM